MIVPDANKPGTFHQLGGPNFRCECGIVGHELVPPVIAGPKGYRSEAFPTSGLMQSGRLVQLVTLPPPETAFAGPIPVEVRRTVGTC